MRLSKQQSKRVVGFLDSFMETHPLTPTLTPHVVIIGFQTCLMMTRLSPSRNDRRKTLEIYTGNSHPHTSNHSLGRACIGTSLQKSSARLYRPFSKYRGGRVRFSKIVIFRASGKKIVKIRKHIFLQNSLR